MTRQPAGTPPVELARELLDACLRGAAYSPGAVRELAAAALHPDETVAAEASQALFGTLVEGLSDQFEPRLCTVYAELFAEVLSQALPELNTFDLVVRYRRIRQQLPFRGDAERIRNVFVLSRITLGADVAITSQVLDAAKRRFPNAQIYFAGMRKGYELFEADPLVRHYPVAYGRTGSLRDRLAIWPKLRNDLSDRHTFVLDPDSRLTQLGLLPLGVDYNYYFFESRGYGREGNRSLYSLTRRWLEDMLGIPDAQTYLAPAGQIAVGDGPFIAMSLGVGHNSAKRVPDPFEGELLRAIVRRGERLWIDKGAGGEESERVERAVALAGAAPGQVSVWRGAFAPFAAAIGKSRLYVGYDSAGQHVAAVSGVPQVAVFAGAVSDRMFARWKPEGTAPIRIIRVTDQSPEMVLAETQTAINELLG